MTINKKIILRPYVQAGSQLVLLGPDYVIVLIRAGILTSSVAVLMGACRVSNSPVVNVLGLFDTN